MEDGKKSTAKIVLLIIGIILTVAFLPVIIFLPLGGGTAAGVVSCFSDKNVENFVRTSAISGEIIKEGWKDAEESITDADLKENVLKDIFEKVLTSKDVEDILIETWKAVNARRTVDYDLTFLEQRLNEEIDKIVAEVPEAAYKAWKGDKSSEYFTESFLDTMADEMKGYFKGYTYQEAVADYNEGIKKYKEAIENNGKLPAEYEQYAEYAKYANFDEYVEAKWQEAKKDLDLTGYVDLSGIFSDIETEIEKEVNDSIASAEVDKYISILHTVQGLSKLSYVFVFGFVIILSAILLVFYLFSSAGFYVTGAGMVIGGIVCKAFASFHGFFINIFTDAVGEAGPMDAWLESTVLELGENIFKVLEKSIWNFGKVSFILGIVMIGVGILLQVLRKNKEAGKAVDVE